MHHDWPAGGKLYKTGDLARYMPDGNIEFLGRMDTQVKVRGFRVEAGEIETVLAQQDGVQDVVVKPHKDSSGQNYLVAYVVARPSASLMAAEITRRLQQQLPEFMVPSRFARETEIPARALRKTAVENPIQIRSLHGSARRRAGDRHRSARANLFCFVGVAQGARALLAVQTARLPDRCGGFNRPARMGGCRAGRPLPWLVGVDDQAGEALSDRRAPHSTLSG
jgi:hypothetical protein